MSELPTNWVVSSIGNLISLNPKIECPDELPAGFVPMQMVGKEYSSPVRFETRPWGEIKKGYTHFANGDVLLAKITPCFENGKAGLVCGLPNGVGAGSTEYFVSRPHLDMLNSRYLYAFLKTEKFLKAGAVKMTGSVGHKRVPKDYLLETELPLAPLPEQKRIADKLDAVLARVDACRDRLDRIPAILKRFRQSVLAAATSGKLTEDWRADQVARMQPQAESGNIARDSAQSHYVVTAAPDSAALHPGYEANTVDWQQTDVQSVAHVGTGSTPLRSNSTFFAPTGTPWITSAATSQTFVTDANEFVTQAAITAHRLKTYPIGTLLVAMYGEGKTRGQVTALGIPATINQACAAIVVNEEKALKSYVKLALQANYFEMRELAEGGNQPNLNLSKIKEFTLPLPGITEQTEIVRRVEALFAFADRLEARHTAARAQVEKLTPSTLAKAFRGELVPQDPNDEPASVLLQRIHAQRNKPQANKPSRSLRKQG